MKSSKPAVRFNGYVVLMAALLVVFVLGLAQAIGSTPEDATKNEKTALAVFVTGWIICFGLMVVVCIDSVFSDDRRSAKPAPKKPARRVMLCEAFAPRLPPLARLPRIPTDLLSPRSIRPASQSRARA